MLAKHSSYSRQEGEKKERKKEEKKELVPSDHKNDTAHKQQLRYARKKRNWLSTRARVHTHTHTHTLALKEVKGSKNHLLFLWLNPL